MEVKDRVMFLQPKYTVYDQEGNNVHEKLKTGDTYTIKRVGKLFLLLEEVENEIYLKEHFKKIKND